MKKFSHSCAVVTGASSGIGKAFAELLAERHYHLVLISSESEALEKLASTIKQKYQVEVKVLALNLEEPQALQQVIVSLQHLDWPIDILINNAGVGLRGKFSEMPIERIREMTSVNVDALVFFTHQILQKMIQQGYGRILNTASTSAFQPGPGMAIYFATKAFVASFSQALSVELEAYPGITVTTLCPGPTKTNFAKRAGLEESLIHRGVVPMWEPEAVAKQGYHKMMQGKRLVVVGWINIFCAYLSSWLPSQWVMRSIKKLHGI